jgi:hypothetical protein
MGVPLSNSMPKLREVCHDASIEEELKVLREKMKELYEGAASYEESVYSLQTKHFLTPNIGYQLLTNSKQAVGDLKKTLQIAEISRNICDIRFAMGGADALIEWFNKPLFFEDNN